ncbi:hypothetical protein EXS65_03925, partial [Candidatus Peribacteria bacterium]|nr:hypothetical protein [Candidatus Peribacteria bacterium]
MWAGSDQSSSDEWFELSMPACDTTLPECHPENLSGYSVTYLRSTGVETLMFVFPENFMIEPGQYLVIGNNHESSSRLLSEPALISASLTLANSGLRLRLKDPNGTVIDEVDDGVGAPFAGLNPSAPAPKASMERIDPLVSGTIKENWKTATTSLGFDAGANMLGTPGYPNASSVVSVSSASSSMSSLSSSISSSLSSAASSSAEFSSSFDASSSSFSGSSESSQSSSCQSDLSVSILLQSGDFTGVGKATLNVQAVAIAGTLTGASCRFDFGDGFRSESCNPGVHSYIQTGVFSLNLVVINQCGNTLTQTQTVTVQSDSKSSASVTAGSGLPQVFQDSRIVISGVLPNPDSKDADKEWIELRNLEDRFVSFAGWHLAIGAKTVRRYAIDTVSGLGPHETVRLYQSETGMTFSNAADTVELINPQGIVVSSVSWKKAEEERVYLSESFKDQSLQGTVYPVIDNVTFVINFDGPSSRIIGLPKATVRLIGVDDFGLSENTDLIEYKLQSLEFMRALTENKKVELFFDTEVWDSDGNLLAYVRIDDGRILQNEMLLSGLIVADSSHSYASRYQHIEAQKKAQKSQSGIWSILQASNLENSDRALNKANNIVSSLYFPSQHLYSNSGMILITEVYPSPSSKEQSGSILGDEWIEFYNPGSQILSLQDWKITIGKKTITFGESSVIEAGKYSVFLVHQTGLKLKNDGDEIILISPDSVYQISLAYPKTKVGESYVFDKSREAYCMSKSASPGVAGSCVTALSSSAGRKVAPKTVRKSRYDTYAASYNATLKDRLDPIVLASEKTQGIPIALSVLFGFMLGSIGLFAALKIHRVRNFVVGKEFACR